MLQLCTHEGPEPFAILARLWPELDPKPPNLQDDPVPEGIRAYAGFDGLLDQDATQEAWEIRSRSRV